MTVVLGIGRGQFPRLSGDFAETVGIASLSKRRWTAAADAARAGVVSVASVAGVVGVVIAS